MCWGAVNQVPEGSIGCLLVWLFHLFIVIPLLSCFFFSKNVMRSLQVFQKVSILYLDLLMGLISCWWASAGVGIVIIVIIFRWGSPCVVDYFCWAKWLKRVPWGRAPSSLLIKCWRSFVIMRISISIWPFSFAFSRSRFWAFSIIIQNEALFEEYFDDLDLVFHLNRYFTLNVFAGSCWIFTSSRITK